MSPKIRMLSSYQQTKGIEERLCQLAALLLSKSDQKENEHEDRAIPTATIPNE